MLDPSEGIAVYTDGSSYYKDRTGGWAFVAIDAFDGEITSSGWAKGTTNNRMEMEAVVQGLDHLYTAYGACDVLVCSDSEYVVLGCLNPRRSREKNSDMWQKITSAIGRHAFVDFQHVRGHQGNHYNEIADDLAGKARQHAKESK
jgi:ribonuclease HI